jgi:hypothetical protein
MFKSRSLRKKRSERQIGYDRIQEAKTPPMRTFTKIQSTEETEEEAPLMISPRAEKRPTKPELVSARQNPENTARARD